MEAALPFLQRLLLAGIGVFALYQCFQVADRGRLARPGFAWAVRICLVVVAGLCFFTVARLLGTS
jgi:predicted Co/Zn/Cd cation transporter (cation efflux family)